MAEFKLVINDVKKGRSYQKVVTGVESDVFKGLKIGSKLKGDSFGLKGYELEVRGGSDSAGFPMRFDVDGILRRKPYVSRGPGVRGLKKGEKTRKTMAGNTLTENIKQINLKVIMYGSKSIEEIFGVKTEEAKVEAPKEEAKVEAPKEEIKETKKEHHKKEPEKKEPIVQEKKDEAK